MYSLKGAYMVTTTIKSIIKEEIDKYLGVISDKSRFGRCFTCGKPFKLKNKNRFYCDPSCSRKAHYIPFRIKKLKRK